MSTAEQLLSSNSQGNNLPQKTSIKGGYFIVPNDLLEIKSLSVYHKMVMICLLRCGNQNAPAFPSYETIRRRCSISRQKAIDVVKELGDIGLVKKRKRKKGKKSTSNLYDVRVERIRQLCLQERQERALVEAAEVDEQSEDRDGIGCERGGMPDSTSLVYEVYPIKNHYQEPVTDNHRVLLNAIEEDQELNTAISFQEYMRAYPCKEKEAITTTTFFLARYREIFGKEHKKMKPDTWTEAVRDILNLYCMQNGEAEFIDRGEAEDIKTMILHYLGREFSESCDHSIPHFNSPNIKGITAHESVAETDKGLIGISIYSYGTPI